MSRNKIYSDGIGVPFKWEKRPGVSKIRSEDRGIKELGFLNELPPPPCRANKATKSGGTRFGNRDPFLMAFKECTKSKRCSGERKFEGGLSFVRKSLWRVSCKESVGVRDDAFVTRSAN